jgi:hypothetical protein
VFTYSSVPERVCVLGRYGWCLVILREAGSSACRCEVRPTDGCRVAPRCRTTFDPRHAAGAGARNTDPHHSGTEESKKGGPLWLRVQGYFFLLLRGQDHLLVLTISALVSTRTGFHPQVRVLIGRTGGGPTAGNGDGFGTICGD